MGTFLAAIQVVGSLVIAVLQFVRRLRESNGDLTLVGWTIFGIAALANIAGAIGAVGIGRLERADYQREIDVLRADRYRCSKDATEVATLATADEGMQIDGVDRVGAKEKLHGWAPAGTELVWVIIHPVDIGSYYVGGSAPVTPDGRWSLTVTFGRHGDVDMGREFEVLILAKPERPLEEGCVLRGWPRAERISRPRTVRRA